MVPAPHYPVWQYGNGGLRTFRGSAMQKGYGLGGFFKGLARSFAPVLKQGLIHVGKKALNTGVNVLGDVVNGRNVKEAVKSRAQESIQDIFSPINDSTQSKKISRKRTVKRRGPKTIKKKKTTDIFD